MFQIQQVAKLAFRIANSLCIYSTLSIAGCQASPTGAVGPQGISKGPPRCNTAQQAAAYITTLQYSATLALLLLKWQAPSQAGGPYLSAPNCYVEGHRQRSVLDLAAAIVANCTLESGSCLPSVAFTIVCDLSGRGSSRGLVASGRPWHALSPAVRRIL